MTRLKIKLIGLVSLALLIGVVVATRLTSLQAQPLAVGGCPLFPLNNVWNTPVDRLPVAANSANFINSIGAGTGLHADFGAAYYNGAPNGIPYVVVPQGQTRVPVSFDYADESDPGPYPIPSNPPIEGGPNGTGDRHILVVEQGVCRLYETWNSQPVAGGWQAGSGAVFDLNSNNLRPAGWTSADAAGLPILPGLARHDEVASGAINHALRFTISRSRNAYLWPGRHKASAATDPNLPPMGQRFRLKASFDLSGFPADDQVILTALKKYGMIVADNGSNWFISGAPDPGWSDDNLALLRNVRGSNFEAVDESSLQLSPDSAQVQASFKASAGTPQGAVVGNAFPNRLQTRLTDPFGNGLSGASVTFQAAGGNPGGTFNGSTTVTTDPTGLATAPPFTANGVTGSYQVTASLTSPGLSFSPLTFNLTNLTACQPANLSPFVVTLTSDDGSGTSCGSLSRALLQASPGQTVTFNLAGPLLVSGLLPPIQAGVVLDGGSCGSGPPVALRGVSGSLSLTVQGHATLRHLKISQLTGPQVLAQTGGNSFQCVQVSKS